MAVGSEEEVARMLAIRVCHLDAADDLGPLGLQLGSVARVGLLLALQIDSQ
jgi:hypothetical protein